MEQGLAQQSVYGDGKNQTISHYYAGTLKKNSKKKKKVPVKGGCKK